MPEVPSTLWFVRKDAVCSEKCSKLIFWHTKNSIFANKFITLKMNLRNGLNYFKQYQRLEIKLNKRETLSKTR